MQKKLLILAVVALVLIGGVVLVWQKKTGQEVSQGEPKEEVKIVENTDANDVDTSDWKTYRNEKYRIQLKYPSKDEWKLEEIDYSEDSSLINYPEKSINIFFSPESLDGRQNAKERLTLTLKDSPWGSGNAHFRNLDDQNIYTFDFNGHIAIADKPWNGEKERDAVYNFFEQQKCIGTVAFGLPELPRPWEANETVVLFCATSEGPTENLRIFRAILDSIIFF